MRWNPMSDGSTVFVITLDEDRVTTACMRSGGDPDVRDSDDDLSVTVRGDADPDEIEAAKRIAWVLHDDTQRG